MSLTLQNLNNNLIIKYDSLLEIIEKYKETECEIDKKILEEKFYVTENEKRDYMISSVGYISEYFSTPDEKKKHVHKNYVKFLIMKNYVSNLIQSYNTVIKVLDKYEISDSDFFSLQKKFEDAIVDVEVIEKISNNCPQCGNTFRMESSTSEILCVTCNYSMQAYGVVYEDQQFFYQDGPRSKHGRYDPSKHCKSWLDTIQALDTVNTDNWDEIIIKPLKALIDRHRFANIELVTCKVIRQYLKELDLSKYNEYIPLIRKMTIGIEPPRLTNEETSAVITKFSQVIQLYLKEKQKPNCGIYYPYILYKIIENILSEEKNKKRCREILSYIHLQKPKTLINHDTVWKVICEKVPGLKYIPTNPAEFINY